MKVKDAHMQAFPFIEPHEDDNIKAYHPGMTMRDEFAKAAMVKWVGMISSELGAKYAYEWADAMMEARKV